MPSTRPSPSVSVSLNWATWPSRASVNAYNDPFTGLLYRHSPSPLNGVGMLPDAASVMLLSCRVTGSILYTRTPAR